MSICPFPTTSPIISYQVSPVNALSLQARGAQLKVPRAKLSVLDRFEKYQLTQI